MAKNNKLSSVSKKDFMGKHKNQFVDHSQFLNSDGYAQAVDVEMTNAQETQIVQVGGQRAMLPEKKRKAKWY
jgi:hypothetical protein